MGTYSFYLTSRNKAKECIVNWNAMDKNKIFKSFLTVKEMQPKRNGFKTTLEEKLNLCWCQWA